MPLPLKAQNTSADVEYAGIGYRAPGLDQTHSRIRSLSLCDQDSRTHGYTAMPATRAMSIDLAPGANGFQRSQDPTL